MALFRGGPDCFLCRVMRSFGISGLGAAVGGFGAMALGLGREIAVYGALAGALVGAAVLVRSGRSSSTKR